MPSKLAKIMSAVNGSTFISMDTTTTPKLSGGKKNPMQGRIRKHNTGANIMVFQNKDSNAYANMVVRRLLKEGKSPRFILGERKWGERLPNLPIVTHKGLEYLEVIFLSTGKTTYTLDGTPINKAMIEGLVEQEPNEKSQGGLNDKVVIRTFKASSIDRLKIGDYEYTAGQIL